MHITEFINKFTDFIFPKISIVSGERIEDESLYDFISDEELYSLNKVTENDLADFSEKVISEYSFSSFTFYGNDDFSKLIYQLKYAGMKKTGILLGEMLGSELLHYMKKNNTESFDFIIPVPLYKTKLRERGYNQSEYIAAGLGKITGAECKTDAVERIKHTKSQTKLHKKFREENVKDAFVFNQKYRDAMKDKRIIVVDDVVTTGATINEVVKVVKENTGSIVMSCAAAMAR
jgi:ComF family protein